MTEERVSPGPGTPPQVCPTCHATAFPMDVNCGTCGSSLGPHERLELVGTTVLGQYTIDEVLGQGGMSVVYKGHHLLTGQIVALKLLPPALASHQQVRSRFVEEARALAALDHPNIVHLYNFGQENGSFVLAMQLVRGDTWERRILEAKRLDWAVTARIAIDVLRALEYAHNAGVIHRDMKPSNVLLRADDGGATVMDFGIAKMTTSTRLTETGQTMGTVRYMSPEQVRGHEVDVTTDIYSLGATIYESVVGETPFIGDTHFDIMTKHLSDQPATPSACGIDLPASFETALMRSLEKKPGRRFSTAAEFRQALELSLLDPGPSSGASAALAAAKSPSVSKPAPATFQRLPAAAANKSRSKLILGVVVGLALVVVAAAAFILLLINDDGGSQHKAAPTRDLLAEQPAAWEPLGLTVSDVAMSPDRTVTARVATVGATDRSVNASELLDAATAMLAAFNRDANPSPAFAPTLNVVMVPQEQFCLTATYVEVDSAGTRNVKNVPDDCAVLGVYFRTIDRTLVVTDNREQMSANLRAGIGSVAWLLRPDLADAATAFQKSKPVP